MKTYKIVNKKRFIVANIIAIIIVFALTIGLVYAFQDSIWESLVNASTTGFFH